MAVSSGKSLIGVVEMTYKAFHILFWKRLRKMIAKPSTFIKYKLLAILLSAMLALCSCSFPFIQTTETAPPEILLPTASSQESAGQGVDMSDISYIEPYLSCLGASAAEISSSFSTSPFDEWEYGGWDGGSPYFIDKEDGIVYYFTWLEELEDDPLAYLTSDTKCIQINFPCSRIYDFPPNMDKAELEKIWGQSFSEYENIEDETWGLYALFDGHYEIRIDCTEKLFLDENSYICILDRNLVSSEGE